MKDPAVLFYIDTWLSATAEMDSDVRGWYLNLILHQFDKKDLPNDIEKLALLAGVKFSEFGRFKQVYEQVLKQKFNLNDAGRLENAYAKKILQSREQFKDKRQKAGNIGVVIKIAKDIKGFKDKYLNKLKEDLFNMNIEQIDKHKDKQVLEQMLKLYINENENENANEDIVFNIKELEEKFENFRKQYQGKKLGLEKEFENFKKKHKDWKQVIDKLMPALQAEINWRKNKVGFVPEWKNLQTWLNQRCWEQEFEASPTPKKELKEIPASAIFTDVRIDYGNSIPPHER